MIRKWMPLLAVSVFVGAGCESKLTPTFRPEGAARERASGASRMAMAEEASPVAEPSGDGYRTDIQAGLLTAGSFDDLADSRPYLGFVSGLSGQGHLASLAARCGSAPVVIHVETASGEPVPNAVVDVTGGSGRRLRLRTRTDGRCVVLRRWDGFDADERLGVIAQAGGRTGEGAIAQGQTRCVLQLPGASPERPDRLDLAFVVDCTGSMTDELEYLKVEIRGIAEEISRRFPRVRQRYALVAYRDEGDEYVTRLFDMDSLDAFVRDLGRQSAGGGGDYPEAVHRALQSAGQLGWDDGHATRMVFHVADAPPHDNRAGEALEALTPLRERAVAVYPVAASGVGAAAEFVMRTEALLTGGQYLFLTDDSGVGNPHAEPHFPHYHVQKLRDVMVRMVASELSGERLEPDPDRIIRTVAPQPGGQDDPAPAAGAPVPAASDGA